MFAGRKGSGSLSYGATNLRLAPWMTSSASVCAPLPQTMVSRFRRRSRRWTSIRLSLTGISFLRRTLALELIELDQLLRDKALEDRDVGSGLLLLKVAERRATLLGMKGHAVQIIQHEPAAAQTSTDKIRAAIDRIRGKSLPRPESSDPDKLS